MSQVSDDLELRLQIQNGILKGTYQSMSNLFAEFEKELKASGILKLGKDYSDYIVKFTRALREMEIERNLFVKILGEKKALLLKKKRKEDMDSFGLFQNFSNIELNQIEKKEKGVNRLISKCDRFVFVLSEINVPLSKLAKVDSLRREIDKDVLAPQQSKLKIEEKIEDDYKKGVVFDNDELFNEYKSWRRKIHDAVELSLLELQRVQRVLKNTKKKAKTINISENLRSMLVSDIANLEERFIELGKRIGDLELIRKNNAIFYDKIYVDQEKKGLFRKKKTVKRLSYFGQVKVLLVKGEEGFKEKIVKHGHGKEFWEDGKTVKFVGKFREGIRSRVGNEFDKSGNVRKSVDFVEKTVNAKIFDFEKLMKSINPLTDLLGKGSFGDVYCVKVSGKKYAMKRILVQEGDDVEAFEKSFLREVALLFSLSSPNIVNFYGWSKLKKEDQNFHQFGILTEFCPFSLQSKLSSVDFKQKVIYTLQIAEGMKYLHGKGVIHRDLKLENILLSKFGVVKIIDFGLAKQIEVLNLNKYVGKNVLGTRGRIAPEILNQKKYSSKADVFSFGILMYEILLNKDPYDMAQNMKKDSYFPLKLDEYIKDGLRPALPKDFVTTKSNKWFIVLMKRCWAANEYLRPTFEEICETIHTEYN